MKKWYEYYSMTQMYKDWKKQHKPKQFVESLPEKISKYWDQYFAAMNDIVGINVVFGDMVYKYHQEHGNIKPLDIGRGPLPGMQQPVAESKQIQLDQRSGLNKTVHSRPQYYKYLKQIVDEYHQHGYDDKQILQEMQNGSLYIHNPNYGISEFIKKMALNNTPFDKIKSYSTFISKKMYQMLNKKPTGVGQISFDQIKDSLDRFLNTQYGKDYIKTKDLTK